MGLRSEGTVLAAYEGLGNATLEYNRTASAPLQEEVLVARRSRVMCDSCSMTSCVLERRGSNLVPMDVDALHREGGKGKKGKCKGEFNGDRNKHDNKGKGKQSVKQRHFDGYCNQCGEYGHKPDCAGKSKFFIGTCNKCGALGHTCQNGGTY